MGGMCHHKLGQKAQKKIQNSEGMNRIILYKILSRDYKGMSLIKNTYKKLIFSREFYKHTVLPYFLRKSAVTLHEKCPKGLIFPFILNFVHTPTTNLVFSPLVGSNTI